MMNSTAQAPWNGTGAAGDGVVLPGSDAAALDSAGRDRELPRRVKQMTNNVR